MMRIRAMFPVSGPVRCVYRQRRCYTIMPMRRLAAEHGWPLDGGEVIALTVDGIGMGENGALWGGECLRVNYRECEHLGGLPAVALPGGDLAAKQPWRNLLAQCLRFVPDWQDYPETAGLQQQNWNVRARH